MEAPNPITETLRLKHLVGGEWYEGDSSNPEAVSSNPARPTQAIASYRHADTSLLYRALTAVETAQRDGSQLGLIGCGLVLRRAAELLSQRGEELARLMTAEGGKTLPESRAEIGASVETLYYHAAGGRAAIGVTFPSS